MKTHAERPLVRERAGPEQLREGLVPKRDDVFVVNFQSDGNNLLAVLATNLVNGGDVDAGQHQVDRHLNFVHVDVDAAHVSIEVILRHQTGTIVVESRPRGFSNVLWRPHVLPCSRDS